MTTCRSAPASEGNYQAVDSTRQGAGLIAWLLALLIAIFVVVDSAVVPHAKVGVIDRIIDRTEADGVRKQIERKAVVISHKTIHVHLSLTVLDIIDKWFVHYDRIVVPFCSERGTPTVSGYERTFNQHFGLWVADVSRPSWKTVRSPFQGDICIKHERGCMAVIPYVERNNDWLMWRRSWPRAESDAFLRKKRALRDYEGPHLQRANYNQQASEDRNRFEVVKPPFAIHKKAEHAIGWVLVISALFLEVWLGGSPHGASLLTLCGHVRGLPYSCTGLMMPQNLAIH